MTYGMKVYRGVLTAMSPIHHGGNEKTGSVTMLNRQKWLVDGDHMSIPFVSGNAVRGQMRRRAFQSLLESIDYTLDLESKSGRRLYHALFTGGVLEQVTKDQGVINLKLKSKLYDTIPESRLFGFAWGNQMIESTLKVGQMLPICIELKDFLPNELNPKISFYSLIAQQYHTRKDDLDRQQGEAVTQMLVDYEHFVPGTKFYHEFRLEDPTPLDQSALAHQIELWKVKPMLGAKSGTGHSELKIEYDNEDTNQIYLDFVQKNKKKMVGILDELQEL